MTLVESLKKFLAKLGGNPNDLENNATSADVIDAISEAYTDKEGTHTEVNPIVTSGTKIATITTNNTLHDIYAPIDSSTPYQLTISPTIVYEQYETKRSYTFRGAAETNIQETLTTIARIKDKDKIIIKDMYQNNIPYTIISISNRYDENNQTGSISITARCNRRTGGSCVTIEFRLTANKYTSENEWTYNRQLDIIDTQQVLTTIKKVDNIYRLEMNDLISILSSDKHTLTFDDLYYNKRCYGIGVPESSTNNTAGYYSNVICHDGSLGGSTSFKSINFEFNSIPKSDGGYTGLLSILIYFKGYVKNGTSAPALKEWYYTAIVEQDSTESAQPIALTRVDVT